MLQVAVVSGKGGTGKTVVTGAIAARFSGSVVMADCDVDASNLALLMMPDIIQTEPFYGLNRAVIDPKKCVLCGVCADNCRFNAISVSEKRVDVNQVHCEGCGVCEFICLAKAVKLVPYICGEVRSGNTRFGPFIDGKLNPGNGNSGLMVHTIRKKAREISPDIPLVLIDGPPGIGCPLISTVTGCDIVLLVTEPSSSGRHDLERLVTVCKSMRCRLVMVINRADLVPDGTHDLRVFAKEESIPILCEIPVDPMVVQATRAGVPFSLSDSPATRMIQNVVEFIQNELKEE